MATKRIVPRATTEGGIGRTDKLMGSSYFSELGLSSNIRMQEASVQTTSATPVLLWQSDVLAVGDNVLAVAFVSVSQSTGATGAGYCRSAAARNQSGTAVVISNGTLGVDIESNAFLNMTWTITGNRLCLMATGYTALTLDWLAMVMTVYSGR